MDILSLHKCPRPDTLVLHFLNVYSDLQVGSASFEFSGAMVYQELLTTTHFSFVLTNAGPSGDDITSTDGTIDNYQVFLAFSDVDLSQAGATDTLSFPSIFPSFKETNDNQMLTQGERNMLIFWPFAVV